MHEQVLRKWLVASLVAVKTDWFGVIFGALMLSTKAAFSHLRKNFCVRETIDFWQHDAETYIKMLTPRRDWRLGNSWKTLQQHGNLSESRLFNICPLPRTLDQLGKHKDILMKYKTGKASTPLVEPSLNHKS